MMRAFKGCLPFVFGWLLLAGSVQADPAPSRPKNVLLICVDDLRPELKSFGATYIHSPNIDALAAAGRPFRRHYVGGPSCGPSRYSLLTGLHAPAGGGNEQLRFRAEQIAKEPNAVSPSMPEWFRANDYTTVSVGKVSHYPGGRTGRDWDDEARPEMPNAWDRHLMPSGPWQHPRGAMHGYANGKQRIKNQEDYVYEAVEGPDTIYPDGLITVEGLNQLGALTASDKPFFLAIGLIKPHLPFGAPKRYLDLYDGVELPPIPHPKRAAGRVSGYGSGEFMGYDRFGRDPRTDPAFADAVRRHYAACVSYADKHVGDILAKLKETGADRNTIVILWGDHGWHLGEHSVWGKHTLFEESLRAPLIVSYPDLPQAGRFADAVVSSLDLFPTLCDLTGLQTPAFAQGVSLKPMLENPEAPGHAAISGYNKGRTIRTDRYRLITNESAVELYDHATAEAETVNVAAQHPDVVAALKQRLADAPSGPPATRPAQAP